MFNYYWKKLEYLSSQFSVGNTNSTQETVCNENFVGTLRFGGEKESFGFKKLEATTKKLVWTLVYVFQVV